LFDLPVLTKHIMQNAIASGVDKDTWLQQCVLLYKERWGKDFRFLACHSFLHDRIRFLNGFDASAVPVLGSGVDATELIDDNMNPEVERPLLGAKAAKKARIQQEIVLQVAKSMNLRSNNSTQQQQQQHSQSIIGISNNIAQIAETTTNIFRMWNMQCMISNPLLHASLRQTVGQELVQQQVAAFTAQQAAQSNSMDEIDDDISDSDDDDLLEVARVNMEALQTAAEAASTLDTFNAGLDNGNGNGDSNDESQE
jgi:hypothetical protein